MPVTRAREFLMCEATGDFEGIASEDLMKKVTRAADYDTWAKDWLN